MGTAQFSFDAYKKANPNPSTDTGEDEFGYCNCRKCREYLQLTARYDAGFDPGAMVAICRERSIPIGSMARVTGIDLFGWLDAQPDAVILPFSTPHVNER
jgi:hypothetical protein